jgi:hypothetical protein
VAEDVRVSDNPQELRYELFVDGELAGLIRYRRRSVPATRFAGSMPRGVAADAADTPPGALPRRALQESLF